jgi:hypothetical protein
MASNSTYGIVKPSVVTADDVDILYNYKPYRNSEEEEYNVWKRLDSAQIFSPAILEESDIADKRLPGMYNLKLPVSIFGNKGYYTVYVKPREFRCQIKDVGTLLAYPDIRGLIIDTDSLTGGRSLFSNDSLTGYRVEYFSYQGDGLYRQNYHRIVTSSNLCEVVSSHQYRFNNSSSLSFVTVTPSTAPSFKANAQPFIGLPSQEVAFVNTKFDPVGIEINMVEHDIETISVMLEGEQVRNLDNGHVTTYNFNGEPYHQDVYFTVKDTYTGTSVAEVKENTTNNFDTSLPIESLKND